MLKANLVNQEGCMFDKGEFETLEEVISWAKDRGGKYTVNIFKDSEYVGCFESIEN